MADDIAAAKKAPDAVDKHVGGRVRMRRLMLAMSQQKLAEALGVPFKQVQKYENGTNRVGAGRLQQISHILEVPVTFFFHDASKASATRAGRSALSMTQVDDLVTTSDGRRVIRAFLRADVRLRHRIVALVEKIVDDDANRTRNPSVRFGRPRRQHHRLHQYRADDGRQVAGAAPCHRRPCVLAHRAWQAAGAPRPSPIPYSFARPAISPERSLSC